MTLGGHLPYSLPRFMGAKAQQCSHRWYIDDDSWRTVMLFSHFIRYFLIRSFYFSLTDRDPWESKRALAHWGSINSVLPPKWGVCIMIFFPLLTIFKHMRLADVCPQYTANVQQPAQAYNVTAWRWGDTRWLLDPIHLHLLAGTV